MGPSLLTLCPYFHALPLMLPRVTSQVNCLSLNPRLGVCFGETQTKASKGSECSEFMVSSYQNRNSSLPDPRCNTSPPGYLPYGPRLRSHHTGTELEWTLKLDLQMTPSHTNL